MKPAFALVLATLGALLLGSSASLAAEIEIVYVGSSANAAFQGVQQGLNEANAQGEFLGVSYRLNDALANSSAPRAIIVDADEEQLLALSERFPDVPVFNISAADNALREACQRNLFHVGPSSAMLEDARKQWLEKKPASNARAQAWHRTFRKYAAAQLNQRYQHEFKQTMNDVAWAGWAAVKLLSDTIVRAPELAGPALIEELQTNLAFDGQKGTDMSFRETGQLRQPLLLIEGDKIVGEAPVRGVVNPENLDSLGLAFCTK